MLFRLLFDPFDIPFVLHRLGIGSRAGLFLGLRCGIFLRMSRMLVPLLLSRMFLLLIRSLFFSFYHMISFRKHGIQSHESYEAMENKV